MNHQQGKRVLVTGAAGFVGANLLRQLLLQRAVIHAIVRPGSTLWRIAEIAHEVTLHRVNLADLEPLRGVVQAARPDFIFHLAARGVSSDLLEPQEIVRSNVLGTANLLEATRLLDYQRFVHFGGSSEYGPKSSTIDELERLEPVTLYGATKAAATLLCCQFARAHRRPIVVLRPFSIYGYWENPARLIPTAIVAALRGGELRLTPPGYRRDLIFVEDVIEACLLSINSERVAGEIINVGTGQQWSNEKVVDMIQAVSGRSIRVLANAYPPRPSDTTDWVADARKARRLLGWQPRHSLRSGLEKSIAWVSRHLEVYEDEALRT